MDRSGPSPRRPPTKRSTNERSPYPTASSSSLAPSLPPDALSAGGKRHDSRASPHTHNLQMAALNAAGVKAAPGERVRSSRQNKFLQAAGSHKSAAADMLPPPPRPPKAEADEVAGGLDEFGFGEAPFFDMGGGVGGGGLGEMGDDPLDLAGLDGEGGGGEMMMGFGGGGGEDYGGFGVMDAEDGMYDDDEGIAAQESQYSSFVGTTYSTFENGAPADATPPPKPKPKAKSSSKKKTKAKAILMEEDGTTPNWDERLKKSLAPRAERKPPVGGKWSAAEDARLKEIVEGHGAKNWKNIAALLGTLRNDVQCLHRWNKVLKPGLHKGPWTSEEDAIVKYMVMTHGVGNVKWSVIASQLHGRIGKQCRERWFNHLDPAIKKGEWTDEEDHVVFEAQLVFGNRWSEIAKLLPGRTENAVKNRFNSSARKKWLSMQSPEKQAMKATGIVKNPNPVEIKRVYKLAENLFVEAAKERERLQAEWESGVSRPAKPPKMPLVRSTPPVNPTPAASAPSIPQEYEYAEGSRPTKVGGLAGQEAIPSVEMTSNHANPFDLTDEAMSQKLTAAAAKINMLVSTQKEQQRAREQQQLQGTAPQSTPQASEDDASSPSSMSQMPEHLRPPGLIIQKASPRAQAVPAGVAYSETPVTQAMRLAGVSSSHMQRQMSTGSAVSGLSSPQSKQSSQGTTPVMKGGKGAAAEQATEASPANEADADSPAPDAPGMGEAMPLDLGVKIFHHLNPAAQRDIMKQLIEKKLVEQYEGMSIDKGKKGGVGGGGVAGGGAAGGGNPRHVLARTGSDPLAFNAQDIDFDNIGEMLRDGGEYLSTGMTPTAMSAANTPAMRGGGGAGLEGGMTDHMMQAAVSAAAATVAGGAGGAGNTPSNVLGGELGADLDMDEWTKSVLMGGSPRFEGL
ncbi:hypothetical protein TeGR_g4031 [Tetraparma gracilis]|uniref:Uncharacterized protein n=1 Tax=Tetraparma gracilis TaxID=2962635 RepID=A0ABQ6MSJ7_9STRA|nr:hypothetical protein TeGR_g4031 [Tetraparma gracilis]